jgi:hypothetical protein
MQGKEGYYKTKVCEGGFHSGKLRGGRKLSLKLILLVNIIYNFTLDLSAERWL